jgi:N4-bis(aminopropyl)spermidine synthase
VPLPEQQVVAEVAAAVGLVEGEAGVRSVLSILARLEPVATRRISRAAELPVPLVAAICGELRRRGIVADARPAQLTPEGRRLFGGSGLGLAGPGACAACGGRGLVVPDGLKPAAREVEKLAVSAPEASPELDQCHCTFDTKLLRVLALHEADALVGRRILLLGDDDLTATTLAAVVRRLGSAGTIRGLTVLDVDPRVVAFARRRLRNAPFPATVVRHDLRDPLPAHLVAGFDSVLLDPPYTLAGARLFLSRAADALAGEGGTVLFSFGSKRPGVSFRVQQSLVEMGFLVRRLVRDFNEYVGAGVLGGSSHLYELTATSDLRPAVVGRFDGPLYTAETGAA